MNKPLPVALLHALENLPGFNREAFVEAHAGHRTVTSIRHNPAKVSTQAFEQHGFLAGDTHMLVDKQVPWCPQGWYLPARPAFTPDPWLHAGAYYVQEASSMFVHYAVQQLFAQQQPPANVLDLCAAPGGKSTLLAACLPDSFLVSNEVIKNRVSILAENVSKWGSSNVAVTNNDPRDFQRLPGWFQLMVVDAPCSGSGLFRKDPGAIDEWSEANVLHCSQRQQRILADVLPALAPGGCLVYSTCSYSPQEDEDICDWLVGEQHLEAVALPIPPGWQIVTTKSPRHQAPGYRFYPDKIQGEGFFIACFRKKDGDDEVNRRIKMLPSIAQNEWAMVQPWLNNETEIFCSGLKDMIVGFEKRWLNQFSAVQQVLQVRKSGVAIGMVKGKDLVPHHELALSALVSPAVQAVELGYDDALKYLKRQELQPATSYKGWALARYQHLNLGWMKLLGNRVNNYYPTEWRILKP